MSGRVQRQRRQGGARCAGGDPGRRAAGCVGSAACAPPLRIRDVTPTDAASLSLLYAAAFDDNPAYCDVFRLRDADSPAAAASPAGGAGRASRHAASLAWLFEKRVRLLLRAGCPFLLTEGGGDGAPVAAAALVPRARKLGALDMLAAGVLEWPLRWGVPSLVRALASEGRLRAPGDGSAAGELAMVAVRPGHQGCGEGGRLVRELLRRWDGGAGGGGGVVALSTQRAANVPFYERAGFVVTRTLRLDGWTSWNMRREAARGG